MRWDGYGDTDAASFWEALRGSPLQPEADAIYEAGRPYTRLLYAQARIESDLGRSELARTKRNFLGQRPRGGDGFASFGSFAECATYYHDKLTDPDYAYRDVETVEGFVHIYAPASDANDEPDYVRRILDYSGLLPKIGGTPVPLTIDVDLVNRGLGKLRDRDAWITIHNNGNPTSDRFDERAFVAGGGGDEGVAYHFAVDAGGAVQIMALDARGVHAGNAEGNATSIAIEMCVGSEPWAAVKENTARLLAAIVRRDKRLTFGNDPVAFSLNRVKEHRQWPGANPACPARLIETDGGAGKVIARAREIAEATPPPKPKPQPPDFAAMPYADADGNRWVRLGGTAARFTARRQTARRQWAEPTAPEVASPVKAGETVTAAGMVLLPDGGAWLVSKAGARMDLRDFLRKAPS